MKTSQLDLDLSQDLPEDRISYAVFRIAEKKAMENSTKIISFTNLDAWKQAHILALDVYKLTKQFPKEEMYSLTDQIRRSAVSVPSNIAEGFSRQSSKEKIQFYYTAKGSLTELQTQLLLAKDLEYISKDNFNNNANQTVRVGKLLTGLIRSIKTK